MADTFVATSRGFSMGGGLAWSHGKGAIMRIYNGDDPETSNRHIIITKLGVRATTTLPDSVGITSGNVRGNYEIVGISAYSEGVSMPINKMNSSATLPAGVKVLQNPIVTKNANVYGRRTGGYCNSYNPLITGAANFAAGRVIIGNVTGRGSFNQIWDLGRGDASAEGLKLAEGTGLAWHQDSADPTLSISYPSSWIAEISFRIGTDMFFSTLNFVPEPFGNASFAIFNESGSGVQPELMQIEIYPAGAVAAAVPQTPSDDSNSVVYMRTREQSGGEPVVPVSMNSDTSLPETLQVSTGTFLSPIRWKSWMDQDNNPITYERMLYIVNDFQNNYNLNFFSDPENNVRDKPGNIHRELVYLSNKYPSGGNNDRIPWDMLPDQKALGRNKEFAIHLYPGEGLVIAQQGFTAFNLLRWEIEFLVIPHEGEAVTTTHGFIS